MLKKAKTDDAAGGSPGAREIAEKILKSSHQIWLAGLGAFSKAQQEGTKVFESLVEQGQQLEKKTKQAAADTAFAARGAAMNTAKEMQQMAGGTWDKLEQVFEERVQRALSKLGVHSQSDVQTLAERVDQLAEAVNRLLKTEAPNTQTAAKRSAASRKTGGKAPAKKGPGVKTATKTSAAKKTSVAKRPAAKGKKSAAE